MSSRILIEPVPCSGSWNMAVDEVLLEAATEGICSLRIYEWAAATVSLGYFQDAADPSLESRFPGLTKVRRLSGGGAILHHHEVTYSITIADGHPLSISPAVLYEEVHRRIIAWLASEGVEVRLRGAPLTFVTEPFLCFSRGDMRDIVRGTDKILGSAQRRRRGAVLQHGALLLARSEHAPEFPGLRELDGWERPRSEIASGLCHALAPLLPGVSQEPGTLSPEETARVQELSRSRYADLSRPATEPH